MRKSSLGEFEQILLLTILRLGHRAFGTPIAGDLENRAGRAVSRGALYSSLDRLEKKGCLRWEVGAATSERGGQPKRHFEVTPAGVDALQHAHEVWLAMTNGLEDVLRRALS